MTDMTPPVGQSRFMLIHAPKQFMVLSVILTNRVNKRLRRLCRATKSPRPGRRGLHGLEVMS
ncbi:hypothetical protein CFBP6624_09405 [Agrobacterium tumefaciens]|uniref:Uncharacterized protein n=1 Tax=Agrobacterium tumefaciens TaxID=358 RepID=A0AAE6EKE7_AGRTU|nr:hypothetical protein CFBP6624_09405 [Agrobacterium tumefaciens]